MNPMANRGASGLNVRVAELEEQVKALNKTLGTLISWMAQSAGSPIRVAEANRLLSYLDGEE